MSGMDRIWAGWRMPYINAAAEQDRLKAEQGTSERECIFCSILESDAPDPSTYVLWRGEECFAILNAYPYTSGHLMVMPCRHVGELDQLSPGELLEMWSGVIDGISALTKAFDPAGINLGANLGRVAGAGVPNHFHMHVVPRWGGDTNFMTTVAEARVLPESLTETWERLSAAWPKKF